MFTGLIRQTGIIVDTFYNEENKLILDIFIPSESIIQLGDSIAINGVCLTVISIKSIKEDIYRFHVMPETIEKTTIGQLNKGDFVNIEPSIKIGRLDGNIVTGHVNNTAKIENIIKKEDGSEEWIFKLNIPVILHYKGCIAINGVSLTIVNVFHSDYSTSFNICLLPYTLKHTTLHLLSIGDTVNIETDCRYTEYTIHTVEDCINKLVLSEEHGMKIAVDLSKLSYTSPNPKVGCIIVDTTTNKIVSAGYHKGCGEKHAEIEALDYLYLSNPDFYKHNLSQCTMYVTLEPCCHHGRTPPCINRVLECGITKVVIGYLDPDNRVSGKSRQQLEENGVNVKVLDYKEAIECNKEYNYHRTDGIPYIYLKTATTANCNTFASYKRYLIDEEALDDVHQLRNNVDAILITSTTYKQDKPKLDTRRIKEVEKRRQPVLFIYNTKYNKLTQEEEEEAKDKGFCVLTDLLMNNILIQMGKEGICSLLVEAGTKFFNLIEHYANEIILYKSNEIEGEQLLFKDELLEYGRMNLGELKECKKFKNTVKLVYQKV
jgi:riboflavin biosynthesis protein RibD/riboflavin synthase alpha subunit